jgi:hypothetical protein
MRPTDNIQKPGSYERLAARMQSANERRKGLSEILRRVQTLRRFEQVIHQIGAQRA